MAERAQKLSETGEIYQQMRKLLRGKDRVVQATAITEIAAVWIYGHEPRVRAALLDAFIQQIAAVVDKLETEMPWEDLPNEH